MKKSPAFQFYPNDWLSSPKVAMMTPAQEGAYIRLLAYCWASGDCTIPSDEQQLLSLSRLNNIEDLRVVTKCFNQSATDSTKMVHDRLVLEHEKQIKWREKSALGGKKSRKQSIDKKANNKGGSKMVEPKRNIISSSSSSSSNKTSNKLDVSEAIVLPDWLPSEAWEEFKQHRKNKKDPLTPLAESKALKLLSGLVSQGEDPVELIDKAIASGWKTFYVSNNYNKQTGANNVSNNRGIDPASNAHAKAQSIIARRTAAWQNSGGEESAYNAT